ncbi:hypothetical protein MJL79_32515, partial [Salmonella enterica subsp. enterica serovar Montevideo]|nr:hypothetical protein [Salmonella enterica subsp. enterica serovar Montevideo]
DAYTQMLEQAGYRVRGFTHPFEAKEWVKADWEGIVLSDVCMPDSACGLLSADHLDETLLRQYRHFHIMGPSLFSFRLIDAVR